MSMPHARQASYASYVGIVDDQGRDGDDFVADCCHFGCRCTPCDSSSTLQLPLQFLPQSPGQQWRLTLSRLIRWRRLLLHSSFWEDPSCCFVDSTTDSDFEVRKLRCVFMCGEKEDYGTSNGNIRYLS